MQLARLIVFKQELEAEAAEHGRISAIEVVIKVGADWTYESGQTLTDGSLISDCERVLESGKHWKARSGRLGLFPIPTLKAIVLVEFVSVPRGSTQDALAKDIKRVLRRSDDAFDARHDQLTGVQNKRTFEDKLVAALSSPHARPQQDHAAVVQSRNSVSVIAFDIDHFKQVNDTFGHLYGDIVLQAFATRASMFTLGLQTRLGSPSAAELARTGGEEFAILLAGDFSPRSIEELAEELRATISGAPLPTDQEWQPLAALHGAVGLELPHASERRITTSIGIATMTVPARRPAKQMAADLKQQADLALYRAKAGGRNTVRRYADILTKCGTILEHHADADVVAIDLGRQVGARVGHEFIVYHPDFTGERPFVYSDGRTKKRLGGYPRYPSGRVVAFDVQPDISFCKVVEKSISGVFPIASSLEMVPVGSIAHLIGAVTSVDSLTANRLLPVETLEERVDSATDVSDDVTVIVLGLANVDELVDERGTAFINRALATLYTSLRDEVPDGASVSQLQATQFAVVLPDVDATTAGAMADNCIASASSKTGGQAKFFAGYLSKGAIQGIGDAERSRLDPKSLLEYARYAASLAANEGDVRIFSIHDTARIVGANYTRGRYRVALADFRRLRELGVVNGALENVGALTAWFSGESDKELAIEASRRAVELSPESEIFRANAGYIAYKAGDLVSAGTYYDSIRSLESLPDVYLAARGLVLAQKLLAGAGDIDRHEVARLLSQAIAAAGTRVEDRAEASRVLALLAAGE